MIQLPRVVEQFLINSGRSFSPVKRFIFFIRYSIHRLRILRLDENKSLLKPRYGEFIVSITSIPSRCKSLRLCIETLLLQTLRPKRILLILGPDWDGYNVPDFSMLSPLIDVRRVDEDLGSHKNYFYALKEYQGTKIMTVDDDFLFDKNFCRDMMDVAEQFPQSIVVLYGQLCQFKSGKAAPRSDWSWYLGGDESSPSHSVMPGTGYCLYPAGWWIPDDGWVEFLKSACRHPTEGFLGYDDSCIKIKALQLNVKFVVARPYSKLLCISEIPWGQSFSIGNSCKEIAPEEVFFDQHLPMVGESCWKRIG